jgi:very-short-patch-repair endonuclease
MPPTNIITGQRIDPEKAARAKELRRKIPEAEQNLWQRLRANRLSGWHFRRQQVIAGFIVDFYCHAAALAIELDGAIHENQVGYDQERDHILANLGVRVLRFQNDDFFSDLETILKRILQTCEEATAGNGPSSRPCFIQNER